MSAGSSKVDEFQPHPAKEQLPGFSLSMPHSVSIPDSVFHFLVESDGVVLISSPSRAHYSFSGKVSLPEAILLGFQHFVVMLGTTVFISSLLVPLMGGGNTWVGSRLPVVMGGSYAFIIPVIAVTHHRRFFRYEFDPHQRFKQTMQAVQGALIAASAVQILLGFIGFVRIFARFLSPLGAIPLVILTGLGLYALGFPNLARCIELGLPTLFIVVFLSQYVPNMLRSKRRVYDRYAVLVAVALVWGFAEILTAAGAYKNKSPLTQISCRTDRSGLISAAPWIRVPYPFQWGGPTFNAGDAFAMAASAFVALVESVGVFIAASRYSSATFPPPSVLTRGVGWLGIATFLNGIFGAGTGSTASVPIGINACWKQESNSDRSRIYAFLLCIGYDIDGKFGAFLASIPLPIFGALYCVLFAFVASAGLNFLQFCNLNSFRTKFILGFSLFMGLSVPQYFYEYLLISGHGPVNTGSTAFNNAMQVLFSSAATVAIMVAFFLDSTHSRGDSLTPLDSGRQWWRRFRYFHTDTRSAEFYSLPYNMNRFFPSF
ncbi:hypothetical protein TIFTF001_007198 [Ficus carica]|uniref:Uncharacterized protein n=1 Tax=Ficus carica TaxID=3494 RepID=A0AA87ZJ12_FICCA|nr:hypothetical protein TIFTF001_007198 [Ficus carica]